MERFYADQAASFDDFRDRLLHGRDTLMSFLDMREQSVWVDMGSGTGRCLDFLGTRIHRLRKVYLVDVSRSMLDVARKRIEINEWQNVTTVEAEAALFRPEEPADLVTFSYSLCMMSDWRAVLENAYAMLKPGGVIGVIDFGHLHLGGFARRFWTQWFRYSGVSILPERIAFLQARFQQLHCSEHRGAIPYVLYFKSPYFLFVGRRGSGSYNS